MSTPFTLNERAPVVVITGAAGHVGRAVAMAMAAIGAQLALLDREAAALEAVCAALPANTAVTPFVIDLTAPAAITTTVAAMTHQYQRIDVLANIAGGFNMGPAIEQTSDDDWERMLTLNLRTTLYCCRAVAPIMRTQQHGSIINVAARAALIGQPHMAPYCVSKAAVVTLTESLAAELLETGVRVNCVLPSIIDTPPNRAAMPNQLYDRWVTPAALADVLVFLASDAARAITGAAIPVYGRC